MDEITTETTYETSFHDEEYSSVISSDAKDETIDKNVVTFPADIFLYRKINLQDTEVSEAHKECLNKDICQQYKDSADIGKIKLVVIDIDTGDNPPISQKDYTCHL